MKKFLAAAAVAAALLSSAHAKEAKTPQQACQAQALGAIVKGWPNVMSGHFEIALAKDGRCLVLLDAPAIYEGKHAVWVIEAKTGDMLSEFYGLKDSDTGLCTYRDGKFPTKNDL
jgi:opacity protein-like surface antigen